MKEVVRKISLDFSRRSNVSLVFASQRDMKSRVLQISLFDDGKPYKVKMTLSALVNIMRPNGTSMAFVADVTSDGCIKYMISTWAMEYAGIVKASVSIYSGRKKKLTTAPFNIYVSAEVHHGDDVNYTEDELSTFDSMMNQLAAFKEEEMLRVNAEVARVTAEAARVSAEKTRVTKENERAANESERQNNELLRARITEELAEASTNLIRMQESFILGDDISDGVDIILTAQSGYINGGESI